MNTGYTWHDSNGNDTHVTQLTDTHLINIMRYKLRQEVYMPETMTVAKWDMFQRRNRMNYALLMQLRLRGITQEFTALNEWFLRHENTLYLECLQELAKDRKGIGLLQAILDSFKEVQS